MTRKNHEEGGPQTHNLLDSVHLACRLASAPCCLPAAILAVSALSICLLPCGCHGRATSWTRWSPSPLRNLWIHITNKASIGRRGEQRSHAIGIHRIEDAMGRVPYGTQGNTLESRDAQVCNGRPRSYGHRFFPQRFRFFLIFFPSVMVLQCWTSSNSSPLSPDRLFSRSFLVICVILVPPLPPHITKKYIRENKKRCRNHYGTIELSLSQLFRSEGSQRFQKS